MGLKGLFYVFLVLGLGTAAMYYWCHSCHTPPPIPKIQPGWWGKGDRSQYTKEDTAVVPFKIDIPDKVIRTLHVSLNATVYPEPLEGVHFEYGFNTDYLKKVVDYWVRKYDWRKQEAAINGFPHFRTQMDGIRVHFLHAKPARVPKGVRVLPLLMVHGWPGSFVEFLEAIPLLTTPVDGRDFVFEVICPSIPGYGFSEAPHQIGFGPTEAANLFDRLMQRLGFDSYYAQGGDWGSFIVTNMAILYPERVKGVHVNMVSTLPFFKWALGAVLPSLVIDSKDHWKMYPLWGKVTNLLEESGYMHLQSTKPDTVGMVLANSPAGLAAYILEKFSTWTDESGRQHPEGLLTRKFTLDQLLTNVMIYYVTGSITSSQRFYKENFSPRQLAYNMDYIPVLVPSGAAVFPNELLVIPENWTREKYRRLVSYTDMPRGGHFAAFEEPRLLADDVWKFVSIVEKLPKTSRNGASA